MKNYIGREEAFEICLSWGVDLPKKGVERVQVPCIASGQNMEAVGKDEKGFYFVPDFVAYSSARVA